MRASIIIANVILISLSSCYTSQKLSLQSIDNRDSIDVLDPKNQLPVKVKGRFHYYTMGDGSVDKIPNTHRVASYYISQDTLRINLSPKGVKPGIMDMHYDIPVSKMESVTFRKFSVWRTCLIPVVLIGVPVATVALSVALGSWE